MFIEKKDVAGIYAGDDIICKNCITSEMEFTSDEIITVKVVEKADGYFFCVRCEKRLT